MLNQDIIREATRLTRAGQLVEATALLQRMLRGESAPDAPSRTGGRIALTRDRSSLTRRPMLLRRRIVLRNQSQPPPHNRACAARCWIAQEGRSGIGLRGVIKRAPLSTRGHRAGGRPVHRRHVQQSRGKPCLQALHPEPLSGATASFGRHASRLHPVAGRFRRRHEDELSRGGTKLLRGLSGAAQPRQTRRNAGTGFAQPTSSEAEANPRLSRASLAKSCDDYSVDPKRVYVGGLSAGAAAAAIMGATYNDLYAAIGIHSGLACGVATDLPSAFVAMRQGAGPITRVISGDGPPVPTIVFHGDRDTTVHPNNGDQILEQSVRTTSTQKKVHRGQVPGGHAYTRTILTDASGRGMLEHWNIHGAGHAWSGGSPAGSYTDPRGPDATREMLRFFLEHSLPDE